MYSLPNVSEIMSTLRAEYARKWRVGERQNRRFDTLATDYLLNKYPDIHKEITSFYETLNAKHSTKHNLTKTTEYRSWKAEQRAGRTTTEQEMSVESVRGTASTTPTTEQEMSVESVRGTASTTPTTEQEMSVESVRGTASTTPTTEQEMSVESVRGTASTTPTTEQEISVESVRGTASTTPTTEQEMSVESVRGTASTMTTPATEQGNNLIPQYHLGLEGMDNILNNLIEELSQDDELRALMNGPFEFELEGDQYIW